MAPYQQRKIQLEDTMPAPCQDPSPIVEQLRGLWQHDQDAAWEFVSKLVNDADGNQKPHEAPSQASAVALEYVLGQWSKRSWGTPYGSPKQRLAVGLYRHQSVWRALPTDSVRESLEAKLAAQCALMRRMLLRRHDQAALDALIEAQTAALGQAPGPGAEAVQRQVRELVALEGFGSCLIQTYLDAALACGSPDWWLGEARQHTVPKPTPDADDAEHLARCIWPAIMSELRLRAGLDPQQFKGSGLGLSLWPKLQPQVQE